MPKKNISNKSYQKLANLIRKELAKGITNARRSFNHNGVVANWNVSKYMHEHLLNSKEDVSSAKSEMYEKLEKDFEKSKSFFYTLAKFYQCYPKIPKESNLTYNHYVRLMLLPDAKHRKEFEQKAIKEDLAVRKLEDIIYKSKIYKNKISKEDIPLLPNIKGNKINTPILPLTRGMLYHYQISPYNKKKFAKDIALVDIGFGIRREVTINKSNKYLSGYIVRSSKSEEKFSIKMASKKSKDMLYTYRAYVERIIDGDTIILDIDCGFRNWISQRIRLRGINCSEIPSRKGREAKNFVEERLNKCKFVIVKTYKQGKFGRFIADIFYIPKEKDPIKVTSQGTFLNQELLDNKLADVY